MKNKRLWLGIALLLCLWATRLLALELLPLHNDEGLHLTRAVEVWNGHPFWAISDGKIINHWLIAAFYPQHAPAFASRVATIFVALVGMAAAYALARRRFGLIAAVLVGALWITNPYLFFYERLAFSDAEAGALVVLAFFFAAAPRSAPSGWRAYRPAVLAGVAFGLAALFKFTAAPYALSLAFLVLAMSHLSLRQRLTYVVIIGLTVVLLFAVPLVYLALKGNDFFAIALGWIGGSSGGQPSVVANLERLWSQVTGFGTVTWALLLAAGIVFMALSHRKLPLVLLGAGLLPLLIILVLGREVLSRHVVVALPPVILLGGVGLGIGLERIRAFSSRQLIAALGVLALVFGAVPFYLIAYTNPAVLPLPADARYEHITSHSSGYALREALQAFPQTIANPDLPIIGSMFPDSCKRANFYAVDGLTLQCVGAPGTAEVEAALAEKGGVYVLSDNAPIIGIDVQTLKASATRIASYSRPGDTEPSVVLWLLTNETVDSSALTDECTSAISLPSYPPSVVSDYVTIRDNHFVVGDVPFVVRGVNYYPAHYPWRRFLTETDPQAVIDELALLRANGFNTLRIFLWNAALFTCDGRGTAPNVEAFRRLDAIILSAAGQNFRLIVTLNDLPDPSLYANPDNLQAQTRFIVERYRAEPAIIAWDVRNEGDIDYGSNNALGTGAFRREDVLSWLEQTTALVRSLDDHHLVTAGWLHDSASTAPYVDFISFHHWEDADKFLQEVATIRSQTDKPLLLEEFGFSTFRISPEDQARLMVKVAQAAENEGLLGWLIWTAFDFPLDATCIQPACPSADNAEHHFGLWYSDHTPKPVIAALQAILRPQ
ncbi:MAG: glycosyltransferase family 39 protein [Anaerolineae bacterium]